MENKTQIKKLYDIARAFHSTGAYISYIEYVLQGNSFSARELANEIYKSVMRKYEMAVRKHADAAEANCVSMADQLNSVKTFAIKYGLLLDYVRYIELVALNAKTFDMKHAISQLADDAICRYDMRLRSKIDASTGITIIGGYKDAV